MWSWTAFAPAMVAYGLALMSAEADPTTARQW